MPDQVVRDHQQQVAVVDIAKEDVLEGVDMSETLPNEFLVKIRFTWMTNLLEEDFQEGVVDVDDGVLEGTIKCLRLLIP